MTPEDAPVDRARLDRILDAEGLATSDDGPGVTGWARAVIGRGLDDGVRWAIPNMGGAAPAIGLGVLLLVALLAAALSVRVYRIVRAGRIARAAPAPNVVTLATPLAPPSRAAVEAALAAGDAAAALRALWRWVAAHVEARGYARPSPDRTNRELVREVRRAAPGWERLPTLARLTDAVDGLLYGGERLDVASVRALLPLADEVVR